MNVGEIIYTLLNTDAAVAAEVGTRIFPMRVAQGAAMPNVRYEVVGVNPNETKSGVSTEDSVRVQIDVRAGTYTKAVQVAQLVRERLDFYRGTVAGNRVDGIKYLMTRDDGDDDLEIHMRMMDFQVRVGRT